MSKSYASYTELECGEGWSCKRVADKVDENWADSWYGEPVPAGKFQRSLRCNIHIGAEKRQKYRKVATYVPASDFPEMVALILEARAKEHAEAIARGNAARAERALVEEAAFAQAWVERSTEAPYSIAKSTDRMSYGEKWVEGYTVTRGDDLERNWNSQHIDVEQDGKEPTFINMRSNGRMTPNKARAVAQALILAANLADERDLLNGPA